MAKEKNNHHKQAAEPVPEILSKIEDALSENSRPVNHGEVRLVVNNSGVYLVITKPQGGAPADFLTAKRVLEAKGIVDYNLQMVRQALDESTGEPVLIAERRPDLDKDAKITISTEEDGMTAYLEVQPPLGGKRLTREAVEDALATKGITFGIKSEVIEKALAANRQERFVIAEGAKPVAGADASISYKFNTNPEGAPVELEDGSVDYHNLDLIQNVKAGDVLAERIPAVPGFPGTNIYGRNIQPEGGKNIRLPRGTNTLVSEENENLLIAKEDGQAVFKDNKVHVFPICTIYKDVSLETGNIDFVGSVIIHGGVRSGFVVHAAGNVEIRGPVEAATIIADGDVLLQRGMQGNDTGQIIGKSVTAKFLEHCKVKAKEYITVNDAIMYCEVEAGKVIKTTGKQGRLVGGVALAGEEIHARSIGSKLGMKTEAYVGVYPEIREEIANLNELSAQKENQFKMVAGGLAKLKKEMQLGKAFTPKENERIQKLIDAHQTLKDELQVIEKRKADLEEVVTNSKKGRILAFDRIYPGVKVSIGKESLVVQDEIVNVCYYLRDGELSQGSAV